MSGLAEVLRWPAGGDCAGPYERRFDRDAERRLGEAISFARGQTEEVADSLARTAAEMPRESLLRVAHAPELASRLQAIGTADDGATLTAFLCEALQAELLLLDPRVRVPGGDGVWTALGDVHFGADPDPRKEGPEPAASIRVDFDSPHNRADIHSCFPSQAPPPDPAREDAVVALRAAIGSIAQISTPARCLTEAFTQIVVCIDAPDCRPGSFSSRRYPGRTVLVNVSRMERDELTVALVHEAVHSLLGVSELGGRLLRRPLPPGATVASPWSGATLAPQALLEAYFVWYGLFWLWQQAAESSAFDPITAETRIDEARTGFEPEFGDVVGDLLPSVHEDTVAAIEELRHVLAAKV